MIPLSLRANSRNLGSIFVSIPVLAHPLLVVGKVARGEEPRVELPVDDRDGGGVVLFDAL